MRHRDDMTFPFAEYERRMGELRDRMADRLLDAVIITDPENLMYLTDYQTTGYSFFQALVVPIDDAPFMITRKLEESNVHARTWLEHTRPYSDTGDSIQMLVESLREFGLSKKILGYERNSYFFPAYHQDVLNTSFREGRLMDCFGIVEEGRKTKSEVELEIMGRAAIATKAGMKAGIEMVRPGVTENEIGAAISEAMFRAGGEPPAVMPYVTSGPRSMIGHATWEGRTVQPNEHVFLEVGGCFRRYHTAMMRTVMCGPMTDAMYKAQEVMKYALRQVYEHVRPGMTVSDADILIRTAVTENDVGGQLITRSGYSIGIAFPPSWDEGYIVSLKQGDSTVLQKGMTLHIIPWMWGVEGDKTCGISDTIYLTDDGCKSFFQDFSQDFVVKGDQGKIKFKPDSAKPESDKTEEDKRLVAIDSRASAKEGQANQEKPAAESKGAKDKRAEKSGS